MGATTWTPYTNPGRTWVMHDGSTIDEPQAEVSGSGRRIRWYGESESFPSGAYDVNVLERVDKIAADRKTKRWFIQLDEAKVSEMVCDATTEPMWTQNPSLYTTRPKHNRGEMHVTWTYEHPTLGVRAVVGIRVYNMQMQTRIATMFPGSTSAHAALYGCPINAVDASMNDVISTLDPGARGHWASFANSNPAVQTCLDMSHVNSLNDVALTQVLLKQCRTIDDLPYLEVPDTRDPSNPAWLRLELVDTTFTGTLQREMTDYLETAPSVTEALEHYNKFRAVLRDVGFGLGDITESHLHRMIEGHESTLQVSVDLVGATDQDGSPLVEHQLHCHLDTGTFVVTCSHDGATPDETALAWDEARMIAQLTGEEPALLAFAKAHANDSLQDKARRVVKRRKRRV